MLNARNDLGSRGFSDRFRMAIAVTLAVAAIALLSRDAIAQDIMEPFDVSGSVVDGEAGNPLVGAWVSIVGSEWGSVTNDQGRFRLPDMDEGPLTLSVELLGYETLTWEGRVDPDAAQIELALAPNPVVLEGLQVVSDRFRSRRNGTATAVRAFDLGDLSTSAQRTALEFVSQRAGATAVACNGRRGNTCLILRGRTVEPVVYIDEARVVGGLEYLDTFAPHELYMVEVFGGGRHIRAYTPQYMERAAKQRLTPIALLF